MSEENQRTEIGNLGEFGLIDRIRSGVKQYKETSIHGIGDDAAIIGKGEEVNSL